MKNGIEHLRIFDVEIDCISQSETITQLEHVCTSERQHPYVVFTPNPEILVYARRHPEYSATLNTADLLIPDGQGLVWASRGRIKERVAGSDVMTKLLAYANSKSQSIGFVIRKDGLSTPDDIRTAMKTHYPQCEVSIITDTMPERPLDSIFVSLGFPQQERWVAEMSDRLPRTKILMTVGGSIDFITGKQKRAPLFFRRIGLEWVWRVILQPSRIKRIFTAVIIFPMYLAIDHFHKPHA